MSATIIYTDRPARGVSGAGSGDELWVSLPELTEATGWELKPEGVCRADTCIPIPDARASALLRDDRLNLAEFARYIEQPYARDSRHDVWSFAAPPADTRNRLASLEAPDFTLPDLDDRTHTLSDFRGQKVLLLLWASW